MIVSRLGKNYKLKASTIDYAIDPLNGEKINLVPIVKEKSELNLFISDNLNFGEIVSCILGMFGFKDSINIPWITLEKNVVCRNWVDEKRNNILLDSPIYPFLNYEIKIDKEIIVSVILVDFSIISFKVIIEKLEKNINLQKIEEVKTLNMLNIKNFKTSSKDEWLIDNIELSSKFGKKIAEKLDEDLFKIFKKEKRVPNFSEVSWSSGEYLDLFNRADLRAVPEDLEIFEIRKHPEEIIVLEYDESSQELNEQKVEDDSTSLDEIYKLLNLDEIKKNNPELANMLPGDLKEFATQFQEQFKNIEQIQRKFLKNIIKKAKEENLSFEEVKELLKEHIRNNFFEDSRKIGMNFSEQDIDLVLSAMLGMYEEELEKYDLNNEVNLENGEEGEIN